MFAVMGLTGSKKETGIAIEFPATIKIAIVSPIARPIPNIIAATMPDKAAGSKVILIICHFVAPKAKLASLNSLGNEVKTSSEILIMVGRTIIPTMMEEVKALSPLLNPKILVTNGERNNIPINPNTTDGMPAIISMAGFIVSLIFGLAISDK